MHVHAGEDTLSEPAPAKLNLALHVTGQREDGYHLLESLVVFAEAGDRLWFSPVETDRFTLSGPFAGKLPNPEVNDGNLVTRARDRLRGLLAEQGLAALPVAIHLEKNLPVASGIGGGSADAAAAIRGLLRFWGADLADDPGIAGLALALGADVPMCLKGRPLIARGIGEDIETIADFPSLHLVLVNPLKEVSTPAVFRQLLEKRNPPLPALPVKGSTGADGWITYLKACRNDLQPPAESVLADIRIIIDALEEAGASLARMSGSGATCFGIFPTAEAAGRAEENLRQSQPGWYVQATKTMGNRA